jgi:Histone methylation protein DOT1
VVGLPKMVKRSGGSERRLLPTNFTVADDRALVALVVLFEDDEGYVDWDMVRFYCPAHSTRSTQELERRLEWIKMDGASALDDFPPAFFDGSCLERSKILPQYTTADIYEAMDRIFANVTRADVRQPSGRTNFNAGEVAPVGVTTLLSVLNLTKADKFLDIGSGIGSVVAQVALQSDVSASIGLEIRRDLSAKSQQVIQAGSEAYPRLRDVKIITGDIKKLSFNIAAELSECTVVYANNLTFQPEDNLGLRNFLCRLNRVTTVLLTDRLCYRCGAHCMEDFCDTFTEVNSIDVRTCWKHEQTKLYIYYLRKVSLEGSLLDIIKQR